MKETLSDIKQKIINGVYKNEEHIRLSLVARLLAELGWDIWNPSEVYTEFNPVPYEDKTKIDIALFSTSRKPDVFIEVKALGKIRSDLERTEIQVRDYNRDNGALFCIITDGQNWRFYFQPARCRFSEKCFESFDLLDDDLLDIEESLKRFLSKDSIENGSAAIEAQKYLRIKGIGKVIKDKLPEARRAVLISPYPSLPEALMTLVVEDSPEITYEEVQKFLKDFDSKPISGQLPNKSYNTSSDFSPVVEQKQCDAYNPPNLYFTKILDARIDNQRAINWNNLLSCAIKLALQREISVRELQNIIGYCVEEGQKNIDGFSPLPGTNVSFAHVDANRAWNHTLALAQKLKIAVSVKFRWREKPNAAFPGKEGKLYWKP